MDTRRIGTLEASVVAICCNNLGWRLDEAATRQVVGASPDAGRIKKYAKRCRAAGS